MTDARHLINEAARALYDDGMRHIATRPPFDRAPREIRGVWERRAAVALVAAFPALAASSDVKVRVRHGD